MELGGGGDGVGGGVDGEGALAATGAGFEANAATALVISDDVILPSAPVPTTVCNQNE